MRDHRNYMFEKDLEYDNFNQYGLKEGARYSLCPSCSSTRSTASGRRDKCLMLDWNTALGTCQHCGEVLQLHTYKKKEPLKPYYAFKDLPNGKTQYWHDDGTTSER